MSSGPPNKRLRIIADPKQQKVNNFFSVRASVNAAVTMPTVDTTTTSGTGK